MIHPWETEPDSLDFVSDGLPCAMRRGPLGQWCGYVGIGPDHPWFGLTHNTIIKPTPDMLENRSLDDMGVMDVFCQGLSGRDPTQEIEIALALRVHGSITWSGELPGGDEFMQQLFWYGFDCGHAFDLVPGLQGTMNKFIERFAGGLPKDKQEKVKKIMHDAHLKSVYRDQQFVVSECQQLAAQLARIGASTKKVSSLKTT